MLEFKARLPKPLASVRRNPMRLFCNMTELLNPDSCKMYQGSKRANSARFPRRTGELRRASPETSWKKIRVITGGVNETRQKILRRHREEPLRGGDETESDVAVIFAERSRVDVAGDKVGAPVRRRTQNRKRDGINSHNKERASLLRRVGETSDSFEETAVIGIGAIAAATRPAQTEESHKTIQDLLAP